MLILVTKNQMTNQNLSLTTLRDKYECFVLDTLQDQYPVQVGKICELLNIKASYVPMSDDISGRIYKENNKYFIEANLRNIDTKRRFTVAHMLGHYCLHKDFLDKYSIILERRSRSVVIKDKKIEADKFAEELLIPKIHFLKKYKKFNNITLLARYFFVSETKIKIRIKNLSK